MGKANKKIMKLLRASDGLAKAAYKIITDGMYYGDDINDLCAAYRRYSSKRQDDFFMGDTEESRHG